MAEPKNQPIKQKIFDNYMAARALTAHATNDIPTQLSLSEADNYPRGIYVGVTGDVEVKLIGDSTTAVVFKNVPQGTIIHAVVTHLVSTNTTATDLVGLW